ncbi:hypothetical protein EAF00_006250 [Botryotinia globosa]|nr:hypothetical protein EAF00_006250 [Botryotinia globosa]
MLWTFKHSHHKLKKEIKDHFLTLDNLLNRFTLEVVLTLPDEFKQLFMNTLTPQMIPVLTGMLNPVRSEGTKRPMRRSNNRYGICKNVPVQSMVRCSFSHMKSQRLILCSLYLANRLKLSRPLTPSLLAIHHITFHDPLGRPPTVLQIDVFNNFQGFQTFLHQSFSGTRERTWVERGLYLLANSSIRAVLTAETWSQIIKPGCHIEMAMVRDNSNRREDRCPDTNCSGFLLNILNSTWKKWLTYLIEPGVAKRNIEKSYPPLSQVAMKRHEPEGSQAGNTATFARCVYRLNLQSPTAQSTEPLKAQKNDAELPKIKSEFAPKLQHSELMSYARLSARPCATASVSPKGGVHVWMCCWCQQTDGIDKDSWMTIEYFTCQGYSHERCPTCLFELVKKGCARHVY